MLLSSIFYLPLYCKQISKKYIKNGNKFSEAQVLTNGERFKIQTKQKGTWKNYNNRKDIKQAFKDVNKLRNN